MNFSDFGLDPLLLRGVADMGFTKPTPIQEQSIPAGVAGRDLLAAAMTGSGKTAAFLLPVLHRLLPRPRGTTRALVLTPTRELAAQILEELELLARHTRLSGAAVFGGVGPGPQEQAFRRGVDVIVATPGRLLDHLQHPYARMPGLEVLVIDEADRMLDMGFLPDVRRVLNQLPPKRQTLFYSATLPPEVQRLSKDMLVDPVAFNIERVAAPATGVTQRLYPVPEPAKPALLMHLLRTNQVGNVIVFTRTKHRTNRLSEVLEKGGFPNARMHGNRSQGQRTDALAGFKSGRIRVLCATDIVARGIDVEALEHVVNFDVPNIPADYIHRVGRTARAEATGEAFTFVSPEEEGDLRAIEKAIGKRIERVTVPGFDYAQRPSEPLEIPIGQRIAEIRARKAEDRERARAKEARRAGRPVDPAPPRSGPPRAEPGRGRAEPRGDGRAAPRPDARPARDNRPAAPVARSGGDGRATWSDLARDGLRPRSGDAVEVAKGVWRRGGGGGGERGGR